MKKRLLYAAAVLLATGVGITVVQNQASAHGAMMVPGSRTYFCWKDGLSGSNGGIVPKNPACAAAVAQGGTTPLYNWFAVLRSDGGGRTTGFIPDGRPGWCGCMSGRRPHGPPQPSRTIPPHGPPIDQPHPTSPTPRPTKRHQNPSPP